MMISINESKPIEWYPYLEVGQGSNSDGSIKLLHKQLPIYIGNFYQPQSSLDILIVCSDLQGLVETKHEKQLLGNHLPEFLKYFIELELGYPSDSRIGVILCGDLFTSELKRGASGDVRTVWDAFQIQFDWVVGVAGNHDRFGNKEELETFKAKEHIYLLHKEIIEIDGLKIGGISGIIGRSEKVQRVEEIEYLTTLEKLMKESLDIILLHESPFYPSLGLLGNPQITKVIESGPPNNIFCGHCFWEKSLVKFPGESNVANVDSKVVIFEFQREIVH